MLPLSALVVAVAVAQPPAVPTTRALTVTPAAEPRPALRYELLPPLRERQPGNAALAYLRAFATRPSGPTDPKSNQARAKDLQTWAETPIDQLPAAEVRKRLNEYKAMLRELDRATAADRCDWETFAGPTPQENLNAILEQTGRAREVAAYLSLRTRLELAEGRFDDATRSVRSGFQMAKHVGESPTIVQLLVGLALEAGVLSRVEDWIARPDSPNLYWTLTALPRPLIDPRPGFEGEARFLESTVPNLARLRAGPLSKDEAAKIADLVTADLRRLGGGPEEPDSPEAAFVQAIGRIGAAGYVAWQLPVARRELLALGKTEAELDRMPPAQVVFLAPIERFVALRDDQMKWIGQPYYLAQPGLKAVGDQVKKLQAEQRDVFTALFLLALPASERAIVAVARVDRKVAALRAVEAVRLYAAGHDGNPPAKLADVTEVPVPDDPYTGKPFGYEATGATVALIAPPVDGKPANADNSLRYEITFREKKK